MKTKSSLRNRSKVDQAASTEPTQDRVGRNQLEVHAMTTAALVPAIHYLTNDEAANLLKLSPRTLEKQRVRGDGPRFRKFGRRVVYAVADLESWANERVCSSTSEGNHLKLR